MQNISYTQNLRESNVEGVSITNDLSIKEQRDSLSKYNQSLTDSQLIIRTNNFKINFELSDDEKEEITLDEEPLNEISTVGINFREHYIYNDNNNNQKEQINFVVANLNLIVKKENEHKKEKILIPIKLEQDKNHFPIIYSPAYHFGTSNAEIEEKISVENRLKSAENIIDGLGLKCGNPDKTDNNYFNLNFRHSEQALFEYLKTDGCISYLIGLMLENKVVKLQSVVLDIYSTKNMCKNCQYSAYGVLSDKIEQQNQEFCGKLERSIKGYNRGRNGNDIIHINNDKKGRTTFYRAIRLIFSEQDNKFENKNQFKLQTSLYIRNIDKRIIADFRHVKTSSEYSLLIKEYTIFCSRGGSDKEQLIKQLKIDRNIEENKNLEQKDLVVEE